MNKEIRGERGKEGGDRIRGLRHTQCNNRLRTEREERKKGRKESESRGKAVQRRAEQLRASGAAQEVTRGGRKRGMAPANDRLSRVRTVGLLPPGPHAAGPGIMRGPRDESRRRRDRSLQLVENGARPRVHTQTAGTSGLPRSTVPACTFPRKRSAVKTTAGYKRGIPKRSKRPQTYSPPRNGHFEPPEGCIFRRWRLTCVGQNIAGQ